MERALSREMLTQLLPPSLLSPAPIPGLALLLGDKLLSPLQGMQTPLCFGRGGGSDTPSLAVMPPLFSAPPTWDCCAPNPLGSCSVPCPGSIAITFPILSGAGPAAPLLLGWEGRWGAGMGQLCSQGRCAWAELDRGQSSTEGKPWQCCRDGCCGCWAPAGVAAWGGTWESWLCQGRGGWGRAASQRCPGDTAGGGTTCHVPSLGAG